MSGVITTLATALLCSDLSWQCLDSPLMHMRGHAVILGCMHPGEYILHHGNNNDNINYNYKDNTNNNNNNNNNNTNSNDDNDDDNDRGNNKFAFQLMMSKVCEEPWQRW